ncbi:hypothetical protein IMSAG049_00696 [Clostridiales bacterium]|nr:hypothetical protein IMSAG049_00696 [Clostridiales bacterium]
MPCLLPLNPFKLPVHLEPLYPVHFLPAADIIDRLHTGEIETLDFLGCNEKWSGDIITNPPYKYAIDFIKRSLELINDGNKVAMFLKLQFLEGKKRKELFAKTPPKFLLVSSSRILCAKNAEFEYMRRSGGSAVAYGWYIWEKGFKGVPQIKWIN